MGEVSKGRARTLHLIISFLLVSFFVLPNASYAAKERRIALVIGNGAYESAPLLKNPVNDARDMTAALRKLGFEVIHKPNADQRTMEESIRAFGRKLEQEGGVGLFYYAGHGMQVRGRNWLIPVDAKLESESDVKYESVDAGRVLGKMEDAGNRLNIVILDACRDNPFVRSFRSADQGLVRMDAPTGSLIAYATAPGRVAADGEGRNGIYTKHLLDHLSTPGLTVEQVLKRVRIAVIKETNKEQVPWESSSLTGNFYFASSGVVIEGPAGSSKAFLSVESNIRDARVLVDGRSAGTTPLSDASISSGQHTVRVEKQGYKPYRKQITVEPGRSVSLYVHLSTAARTTARLYVNTKPEDARIRILNIRPKFYQGMELAPGTYHLEASAAGHETQTLRVTLRAGEDKNVGIRLDRISKGPVAVRVPYAVRVPSEHITKGPAARGSTNSIGMEFVLIQPGTFMMGSPSSEEGRDDDEGQHRVTLTKGFYMQTTEVTQGQWKTVMGNNPSYFKNCGEDCPVEEVSWNDAQHFIRRLNHKEGTNRYRLPTESEWEYAARSGSTTAFANGDIRETRCGRDPNLSEMGWYCGNASKKTHPVARKKANAWGLYDMHGNVWEWCQDWYGSYPSGSAIDPAGPSSGSDRVIRGGSWYNYAKWCRSGGRGKGPSGSSYDFLGFRLVRDP